MFEATPVIKYLSGHSVKLGSVNFSWFLKKSRTSVSGDGPLIKCQRFGKYVIKNLQIKMSHSIFYFWLSTTFKERFSFHIFSLKKKILIKSTFHYWSKRLAKLYTKVLTSYRNISGFILTCFHTSGPASKADNSPVSMLLVANSSIFSCVRQRYCSDSTYANCQGRPGGASGLVEFSERGRGL